MKESDANSSPAPRLWVVGTAIAWLVLFAVLFFRSELPGSPPSATRFDLALLVPDLLLDCFTQHADEPPSGWQFFPQRLPLIVMAGWILVGAWGCGALALRGMRFTLSDRLVQTVLSFGAGLSCVSLLMLGIGLLAQFVPAAMSRAVLGTLLTMPLVFELLVRAKGRTSLRGRLRFTQECPESKTGRMSVPLLRRAFSGRIPFPVLYRGAIGSVLALFVLAMALGAMLPPIEFDAREYHLGGPKEWFQTGSIHFLPHNVYTNFPFLTEMLLLAGMVLTDDWYHGALVGQLVLMSFAPLTSLAVFAIARRWFGTTAAWFAALIHLSTPWTYLISVTAFVEGGLTFYLAATVMLLGEVSFARSMRADERDCGADSRGNDVDARLWSSRRATLLIGFIAGSAFACKYPGLISVTIPAGVFACLLGSRPTRSVREGEFHAGHPAPSLTLRVRSADSPRSPQFAAVAQRSHEVANCRSLSKRVPPLLMTSLIFVTGVLLSGGPWLLKNLCQTGNPVYPLASSLFGGVDWDVTLASNWHRAHAPPNYSAADLARRFADVTVRSEGLSPLLFALAPLALLVKRNRRATQSLLSYAGFLFLSWWLLTHRIDRFWIPLIPVVSVLAGAGACWSEQRAWHAATGFVMVVGVLFNLGLITTPQTAERRWLGDEQQLRAAAERTAPAIAALNQVLPPDASVLLVGEAQIFDARFRLRYNTVFDVSLFEEWCSAGRPHEDSAHQPLKPAAEIRARFQQEGITHVFVNWREMLRYRTTYGVTDFIAPPRFAELQRLGVLRLKDRSLTGVVDLATLQPNEVAEVERWAPSLIIEHNWQRLFVASELFEVIGAESSHLTRNQPQETREDTKK